MSQVKSFSTFFYFNFLLFFHRLKTDSKNFKCRCGSTTTSRSRPYERRQPVAPTLAPQNESVEVLVELEGHLERLTRDIPENTIDDISR